MGKDTTASEGAKQPAVASRSKKVLILFGLAIVLLVVGVVGYAFLPMSPKKPVTVCSSAVTREGNAQFKLTNVTTYGRLVEQIKKFDNYERDPNCLYIVAEYHILNGDFASASTLITKLKAFSGNISFDKNLDDGKASMQNLQKYYDNMKASQDSSNGMIDPGI